MKEKKRERENKLQLRVPSPRGACQRLMSTVSLYSAVFTILSNLQILGEVFLLMKTQAGVDCCGVSLVSQF